MTTKEITYFIVQDCSGDFCQDCSYSGWSNHLRSIKTFHFIVKASESSLLQIDSNDNLLHAKVHLNGMGHLLWVKASAQFSGTSIMNCWDDICSNLCVREVSLLDTSTRNDIPLRVLFGLSKFGGFRTWFEQFGYHVSQGCFGTTIATYEPVDAVFENLNLKSLLDQFCCDEATLVHSIICNYYEGFDGNEYFRELLLHLINDRKFDQTKSILDAMKGIDEDEDLISSVHKIFNANLLKKKFVLPNPPLSAAFSFSLQVDGTIKLPDDRVLVPRDSTIRSLKTEIVHETYDFRRLTDVGQLKFILPDDSFDIENHDDDAKINSYFEPGASMLVEVSDSTRQLRVQKDEEWKVVCRCGAIDDDGEYMFECDTCGVWSHRDCNPEYVNESFVCFSCRKD